MLRRLKEQKGFTLMEIIIVIVILGILALLAIPRLLGFTEQAEIASDKEYAAVVARAAELYWASHEKTITDNGATPPVDASRTNTSEVSATGMDADLVILEAAGLVDDPTVALQFSTDTFEFVEVQISTGGIAQVSIFYDAEGDIVYDTENGYTTLPN